MVSNNASGGEVSSPSDPPSASTFSFKAPLSTVSSSSTPPSPLKHRRVSLALPSSPRVVQGWSFRDDTGLDSHVAESAPYASSPLVKEKKGKIRKIASPGESDDAGLVQQEKKPRKKWTPEETQMLVDGCNKHGVGNWKMILRDPTLKFDNRSPVDLKDRFRTYFPDAYKQHYPNARTHLSSKVRSTLPDGSSLFEKTRSKRRRPFTEEEDRALKEGYEKYGTVWATIVKDYPVFQEQNRRSTDLRDRFRNAFPELYQLAGYKPRNASKKKLNGEELKTKAKRAVDDQLATMSTGGPVRSRRRAHTSQGLLRGGTKSVPQSTACSEDEDSSGGEDEGDTSPAFKPPPTPVFVDNVSTASLRAKMTASSFRTSDGLGLDDDEMEMVTLDPLSEPLALPDFLPDHTQSHAWSSGINTPTHSNHAWSTAAGSPTSSHLSADYLMNNSTHSSPFLQRRSDSMNLNALGSNNNNNMGMIGKSAWGTQDWFSPNPRLDPNSSSAMSSSYLDQASPASPFSFNHLNHGVLDRYDLFPTSMPHDFSSEVGVGDSHSTFSDEIFQPNGFRGFTHHSSYAGDLIFGARTHQPLQQNFYPSSSTGGSFGFGLGLSGMSLSQNTGIHPMQLHSSSLLPGIDEIALTGITLDDQAGTAGTADPLGIPLPPDVMEEDSAVEAVPVIESASTQAGQALQQSQLEQQRSAQQLSEQQKGETEVPTMMSDRFNMDDLVDLSNEFHATPPATPLTHPRPLRRSSGSMLQHYSAGGAMHARSISVPPSEFRNAGSPMMLGFEGPQRIIARNGSQTDLVGVGVRNLESFQSTMDPQQHGQGRRQDGASPNAIDDGADDDGDDTHGPDERPQTPTIASRYLTPLPRAMTATISSSSSSSLSSSDSWRLSGPGNLGPDLYDLPFLDLHYYGHGGIGAGGTFGTTHPGLTSVTGIDLMDMTGQTQAQALDLAQSSSSTATRSTKPADGVLPHGVAKQHVGTMHVSSPVGHSQNQLVSQGSGATVSMFKQAVGLGRSQSHHRGQSAVNPQDLTLRNDNNKRKRASWDGRPA